MSSSSSLSSESDREDSAEEEEAPPLYKVLTDMPERFNSRPPGAYGRYLRRRIAQTPCNQVDDPDDNGNTPLMLSMIYEMYGYSESDRDRTISALLDKGADVHIANNEGITVAMRFIADMMECNVDLVKDVLNDEPDQDEETVIKVKSVVEHIVIVTSKMITTVKSNHWYFKFVSKLELDVNQKNENGLTPLLIAVDILNFPAIDCLLGVSNEDSCVKYPDGEWLLSRLMNRFLGLYDRGYDPFHFIADLLEIFEQLYNLSAFEICEQSSVDPSPVVDILCTQGLVDQIMVELSTREVSEYQVDSIHDLNLLLLIVASLERCCQVSDEFRTHLAKYLLSIVLKPNNTEQFLLSMVSRSKTLVEVFVKTGAMPVVNISQTTNSNLFYHEDVDKRLESFNSDCFSAFLLSFCLLDVDMANMFIKANFLLNLDLHPSPLMKSKIQEITENHPEMRQIYRDFYCQPHPLYRLCFVKVSTCVGFGSDRQERLSLTGLWHHLQRLLMFE